MSSPDGRTPGRAAHGPRRHHGPHRPPPRDSKADDSDAAVIGREFGAYLLGRIADIEGRPEDSLAELRALEFIYEKTLFPDFEYSSSTPSSRTWLTGASEARRRALDEPAGGDRGALRRPARRRCRRAGLRFRPGRVWTKAFEYTRRAADRAGAIFANREAIHSTPRRSGRGPHQPSPRRRSLDGDSRSPRVVWQPPFSYDEAVADFEAIQQAAARLGDRVKEGEALCNQASSHWWRLSEAYKGLVEKCAREAMAIAEETGDERILARGLYSLAMVDQKAGNLHEADTKLLHSVEICRRRKLTGPLVTDLTWLGAHAGWRGDYRPSLQYSSEAARLAETSHEGLYELVSLCFLCNAHAGLGEWDLAFKVVDEVRQKSRERENKYGMARGLNTSGWLHRQLGDLRQAIDLDREALDLSRSAKLANPEIYSTLNMAEDHLALNEIGTAQGILLEAAERLRGGFFDSHLWKWQMAVALMFARVFLIEGDLARADTHLTEGLAIAQRTESRRHLAEGLRLRGEIWFASGRAEDARTELRRALEFAEGTAAPRTIWETAGALGRALGPAREAEARDAYRRALEALHGTLPRIPRPELRDTLLRSELVAQLIEEAARLGVTLPPDQPQRPAPPPATPR